MMTNRSTWLAILALAFAPAVRAANPPASGAVSANVANAANGAAPAQPGSSYRLSPRDLVHIKVFQEEDLETTGRVGKDGTIAFPLLGSAKIGGQTVPEATATMESLLREYLVKPQVSLEIVAYSKQRFTILGQVNKPGVVDMPDEASVNLLEAIGMAGGYTKIANPSKITIKRIVDGREAIIRIDARKILKDASSPTFQVLPGDTIMVGEAIF